MNKDIDTLFYSYRDKTITFEEVMEELGKQGRSVHVEGVKGRWAVWVYQEPPGEGYSVREAMEHFLQSRMK